MRFFLAGLCIAILVALMGENPAHILKILALSSFGTYENFSYTLFYSTPLLLTGTAVALALQIGLFNIGAEGQIYAGALCAAFCGKLLTPWFSSGDSSVTLVFFALLGVALLSFVAGAIWGAFAGYLRSYRNVHEVIATIMLNFIILAFSNWVILYLLKNPFSQNPETVWIPIPLQIPRFWQQMTLFFPFALVLSITIFWAIRKTWLGFRVRAVGYNETASKFAGISIAQNRLRIMALSGGIAALVGFHEVFFHAYRLIDGFSPGYGFTGVAIALLARGNAIKLIFAALLFASLYKGALDLDLETEKITRDLSIVIQAVILIVLSTSPLKKVST